MKPEITKKIFKRVLILAFLLFFIDSLFQQWMTEYLFQQISSRKGVTLWIWVPVIFSVLFSVSINLTMTGLVLVFLKFSKRAKISGQNTPLRFFSGHLNQLFIENLRALGKTFSWSFLFILPGLYKWISFTFVPFVVLFDKEYQLGHRDALEYSSQMTRQSFFKVLGLLIVFSVIGPIAFLALDDYVVFWNTPIESFLIHVLKFLMTLGLSALLLKIWEGKNGTLLHLERN